MPRLIESQLKDALNMSQWIDASPHEWPSADKIPHLCFAILDQADSLADAAKVREWAESVMGWLSARSELNRCPHCFSYRTEGHISGCLLTRGRALGLGGGR